MMTPKDILEDGVKEHVYKLSTGDAHAYHVYLLQQMLNTYSAMLRKAQSSYYLYNPNVPTLKRLLDLTAQQLRQVQEIQV